MRRVRLARALPLTGEMKRLVHLSLRTLGLAALLVFPSAGYAQVSPQASPPPGSLQGLSPEALDNIVASARPDAPATLTFANREIVVLRAALLGRTSAGRVEAARQLLTKLARDGRSLRVTMRAVGRGTLLAVDGRDVFAIVPADVDELSGETLHGTSADAVRRLQQALDESLEASRPRVLLVGLAQALLATVAFGLALWLLTRAHRSAGAAVAQTTERTLSASKVTDAIVRQTRLVQYVRHVVTLALVVVGLSVAYMWLTFVLRRFPYSRPWGESLRTFLLDRFMWLGTGIVEAIPSLFTVILIVFVTRLVVRVIQLLFIGVEQGRITIPWVHQETAAPTRKLATALLWLFALIVSYPYLPGSETDVFKGVSVFIGLMVSLGSSGLVNQVMSGFTVTYSRALRRGDFVRIAEIEGTVTQIGTLSTKIETPRREEVTIPNTVLVSQTVTNYSRNADTLGVHTPTSVTIGYDTPWRQVEALLLLAASRTDGVRCSPPPIVLQASLEDFYVRYILLVSLEAEHRRGPILNRLHGNIQDAFNEHGVQIMSPNYEADPTDVKVVPKERWFATPAADTQEAADRTVRP
jgi:small-conductance mechanosensitive channel